MSTVPLVATEPANGELEGETNHVSIPSASSLLQSAERIVTPIQQPLPAGRPVQQQPTGGFTSAGSSANPTFAVLKSTVLQQAFGHPLAYARVLMQIGYEPIAAAPGKTIFGKEALFYPNVFRYLKFIYNTDGFTGLYRGFGCAVASKMVCWYTTTKADELLGPVDPVVPGDQKSTWNQCVKKTLREVRCQSWGILLSHPLQVMAVRCMGQFIGRETTYSSWNIVHNIREIYDQQGIGGFFVGLVPRWLLDISTIIISNVLIQLLKSQLPAQDNMVPLYEYMAALFAQTATYPLSVVATVTAINQSGLRAGITPVFANWQEAYRYLGQNDQLKRGSSLFNRVAIGSKSLALRRA